MHQIASCSQPYENDCSAVFGNSYPKCKILYKVTGLARSCGPAVFVLGQALPERQLLGACYMFKPNLQIIAKVTALSSLLQKYQLHLIHLEALGIYPQQ